MSAASPPDSALLLVADRIHSLDPATDAASPTALLVVEGLITALGSPADLQHAAPGARRIDLAGATITPGLTDAHAHLTEWALTRRQVDLAEARSPGEAARRAAEFSQTQPVGQGWIRGGGWNPHAWNGPAPHRQLLDAVFPEQPVALYSHDMHALWVNSAALGRAGISAATPDPDGGHIGRDPDGQPDGLLLENATRLVTRVIPDPTLEETAAAVAAAQAELHRLGITGVHSFPGIFVPEPEPLPVLEWLRSRDLLRLRVLQHIRLETLEEALRLGLRSGFGGSWLRIGGIKMFLDGALGSRTAWMRAPYLGSDQHGMQILPADTFRELVRRAAAGGLASTVHAIGDAAVCLALDVLADAEVRVPALPHRIEHVQCCPVDRLGDAGPAGITCSVQPAHLITDWAAADRHWGPQRTPGTYAFRSLADGGATLAFGSDVPVEPVDPRLGLHAATARTDLQGNPAPGWHPEQLLNARQAFLGYTVGPAIAAGRPAASVQLRPGAAADLVAWDRDPLQLKGAGFLDLHCVATVVGGQLVWRRDDPDS